MNDRGTVSVEYVILLVLVVSSAAGAMVALGPILLQLFVGFTGWILLPFP